MADEASYSIEGATLADLKPINFIFGTNGAGKTSISRVINDPDRHPACRLEWAGDRKVACSVYNIDFVSRTFAHQFPGIFTLGEAAADTLHKIDEARAKVQGLENEVARHQSTLGTVETSSGKQGELSGLRSSFEADCWKIKSKHDNNFKGAFTGVRSSQAKFCQKVLAEVTVNTAAIVAYDELVQKAAILFGEDAERYAAIPMIDVIGLREIENAPVLAKKVIGKEDVDVAALIRVLGNGDWVRQGLPYLAEVSQCPFCQQDVDTERAARLNDYFDGTYRDDIEAIDRCIQTYERLAHAILDRLREVIALDSRHLDQVHLQADIDRFSARVAANKRQLEAKRREPNCACKLEDLEELTGPIITRIKAANVLISSHNLLVNNIDVERRTLIAKIWKFLLEDNKLMIEKFREAESALNKAVEGLTATIKVKNKQLSVAGTELQQLQKTVTSVHPTVLSINALLRTFGFSGFRLKTAGERDHLYEIQRDNGGNAAATLSEGERSFVCFLYFFYLLLGTVSEADVIPDRVVVFDDPVSSLDSDVLFIVGSLIKRLLREACGGKGRIKQVFVLTHNIYFHREVSYDHKRGTECRSHETFWIVQKVGGVSRITGYNFNPIKTSYELLWAEVRNPNRSNLTIQNTLRRIIENYFKILGNVDKDDVIAKFDGKDQQVCASLFSWLNDGSHSAHDDLYISTDDSMVDRYLDVFRCVFEKTDHFGHYKMMMGPQEPRQYTTIAPKIPAA